MSGQDQNLRPIQGYPTPANNYVHPTVRLNSHVKYLPSVAGQMLNAPLLFSKVNGDTVSTNTLNRMRDYKTKREENNWLDYYFAHHYETDRTPTMYEKTLTMHPSYLRNLDYQVQFGTGLYANTTLAQKPSRVQTRQNT
jgi:hypothetical protein